jgi:hypothetical protein
MRRLGFISVFIGAAAWPLAVQAQQTDQMHRIGVLTVTTWCITDLMMW